MRGTSAACGPRVSPHHVTEDTFARLAGVLREGAELVVEHLYVDGDTTIAELRATSTTNEGASFAHLYVLIIACW